MSCPSAYEALASRHEELKTAARSLARLLGPGCVDDDDRFLDEVWDARTQVLELTRR